MPPMVEPNVVLTIGLVVVVVLVLVVVLVVVVVLELVEVVELLVAIVVGFVIGLGVVIGYVEGIVVSLEALITTGCIVVVVVGLPYITDSARLMLEVLEDILPDINRVVKTVSASGLWTSAPYGSVFDEFDKILVTVVKSGLSV